MYEAYRRIGFEVFGPVFVGFADFLAENTSDTDRIFFISRDATRFLPLARRHFERIGRSTEGLSELCANRAILGVALDRPEDPLSARTVAYLRSRLSSDCRHVLVDIGYKWASSLRIHEIVRRFDTPADLLSAPLFYDFPGRDDPHPIRGYFGPDTLDAVTYRAVRRNNSFLESVLGDKTRGELLGYEWDLTPVFGPCEIPSDQLAKNDAVYEGIAESMRENEGSSDPSKLLSDLAEFAAYPSAETLELFWEYHMTDNLGRIQDRVLLRMFDETGLWPSRKSPEKKPPYDPYHRNIWMGGKMASDGRARPEMEEYYAGLLAGSASVTEGRHDAEPGDTHCFCI